MRYIFQSDSRYIVGLLAGAGLIAIMMPGFVSAQSSSVDADGDGYAENADCDDQNPDIHSPIEYRRDRDGDGLGDIFTNIFVCSTTPPEGYVETSDKLIDHNDYDYDNDGWSTDEDCNDNDIMIGSDTGYYPDKDGDGLGDPRQWHVGCSTKPVSGWVTNGTDPNDRDYDNDGIETTTDCNDKDASLYNAIMYCEDKDGDGMSRRDGYGYGESNEWILCENVCSSTAPEGFTTVGGDGNDNDYDNDGRETDVDCNDGDKLLMDSVTYYQDSDGDGLGAANAPFAQCSLTNPSSYVTDATDKNDHDYDNDGTSTDTDCNDMDAALKEWQTAFQDADKDSLGDAMIPTQYCGIQIPGGYVGNSSDTNDAVSNFGIEISGDGIDNDDDGEIDEVNVGRHPFFEQQSEGRSITDLRSFILSVSGGRHGSVLVEYADHSLFRFTVFAKARKKKIDVQGIPSSLFIVALHPQYKSVAVVRLDTGDVVDRMNLVTHKKIQRKIFVLDAEKESPKFAFIKYSKSRIVAMLYGIKNNGNFVRKDVARLRGKNLDIERSKNGKQLVIKSPHKHLVAIF